MPVMIYLRIVALCDYSILPYGVTENISKITFYFNMLYFLQLQISAFVEATI
jgi:hypothetical protein